VNLPICLYHQLNPIQNDVRIDDDQRWLHLPHARQIRSEIFPHFIVLRLRKLVEVENVQNVVCALPEVHGTLEDRAIVRHEGQILRLND
jgi:hypothetical protein